MLDLQLLELDMLSEEAIADPYAFFAVLREHDPVHYNVAHRSWVITRYEDVAAGFLDLRLSSDRVASVFQDLSEAEREARAPTFKVLSDWMVFKDPPDHRRLRDLVKLALTPRAVQALAPKIERIVDHVLATSSGGEVDVVRDVAYPIPALVIAEMLGVPASDRDLFRGWSNDMSAVIFQAARTDEDRQRAQGGLLALSDYLRALVSHYGAHPADNLLTSLVRARENDDTLTEDEIVATCVLLLFGGHETTTNLIANGFLALLRNPEQAELLLAGSLSAPDAVEELNRYDGPAKMVVRRAAQDFELHGKRIEAGQRVLLVQCAANRDPRRFERPDELDLRRTENRNVAFGFGIHYCLGASLARLETVIALPRMLSHFTGAEPPAELTYQPLLLARGLSAFPIGYGA
jgi:cytochrome P450